MSINLSTISDLYIKARIVGVVADLILIVSFAAVFIKALKYRPNLRIGKKNRPIMTIERAKVQEKWADIMKKFASGSSDNMKLAIIYADKLVDSILKNAGLDGEHMADRLDNIDPGELASLDRLWHSHKVRNQLVHGETELSHSVALGAIKGYEEFLKEIQAI